jgi:hypothetical protein
MATNICSAEHKSYRREGNICLPNPRCVSFSSVSLVLFLLLKQTYPPPSHSPYPIPRCVLTDADQPPTLVEAWLAYKLLPNSTGTWGTRSTPGAYSQTETPPPHPRLLGCVACAHTAATQHWYKAAWSSFGYRKINLAAKNCLRSEPASLHAKHCTRVQRLSAGISGEIDKLELVSLPPIFAETPHPASPKGQRISTYSVQRAPKGNMLPLTHTTTKLLLVYVSVIYEPRSEKPIVFQKGHSLLLAALFDHPEHHTRLALGSLVDST